MKKKLSKIFITILAIGLISLTLSTAQVQATLQSNQNTHYTKFYEPEDWMPLFRNMEKVGGALGLSETINETNLLATSESNNLDSHMIKSTEYGAIAILSASGYGNQKTLQNSTIKSTTGNETGVYFYGASSGNYKYCEWVAGGSTAIFSGVDGRYYNSYGANDNNTARVGDALGSSSTTNPGCQGWHSAGSSTWVKTNYAGENYFIRNYQGKGIFGFNYGTGSTYDAASSRGVIVCGEGL